MPTTTLHPIHSKIWLVATYADFDHMLPLLVVAAEMPVVGSADRCLSVLWYRGHLPVLGVGPHEWPRRLATVDAGQAQRFVERDSRVLADEGPPTWELDAAARDMVAIGQSLPFAVWTRSGQQPQYCPFYRLGDPTPEDEGAYLSDEVIEAQPAGPVDPFAVSDNDFQVFRLSGVPDRQGPSRQDIMASTKPPTVESMRLFQLDRSGSQRLRPLDAASRSDEALVPGQRLVSGTGWPAVVAYVAPDKSPSTAETWIWASVRHTAHHNFISWATSLDAKPVGTTERD